MGMNSGFHLILDQTFSDLTYLELNPVKPKLIAQETTKDHVLSKVQCYTKEGWLKKLQGEIKQFKKLENSLATDDGCLFYWACLIILDKLHTRILEILHLGHFGMQRMKQLARSVIYWPHINGDIEILLLPEKPWSSFHLDRAITFMGTNWLVIVDAYSKYPCIHVTSFTSTEAMVDILEQQFVHFGYPHTLVMDNVPTSDEFQEWCSKRGIAHLSGTPYQPATKRAAERLVETFKQSPRKSVLSPKAALQEFLMLNKS